MSMPKTKILYHCKLKSAVLHSSASPVRMCHFCHILILFVSSHLTTQSHHHNYAKQRYSAILSHMYVLFSLCHC